MFKLSNARDLLDDDVKKEAMLERLCLDLFDKVLTPVDGQINWRVNNSDISVQDALSEDWRTWEKFDSRSVWGKKQGHTFFVAEIEVPQDAKDKTFLLRFTSQWNFRPGSTDPQCLAYIDSEIAQAIDGNHTELVIARNAVPGQKYMLMVDAFTFFDRPIVGFTVEYLVRHERAEQLYFDLQTPLEVALRLQQNDGRRHEIFNLVEKSLRSLDRRGGLTPAFETSLAIAEKIAGEIYELVDTESQPTISAVGHTHLDVAWLWRVLHTREKTGRSFATVLALMEEYPEFIFMYNQSVMLDFFKKDYPEQWEKLNERVRGGQFEIEGAMWVEPDANIVSGESLVRQIMQGRRFHMKEFNVEPKTVWLPDTFGYSANIPQIMLQSGLEFFVTSKLSWNDTDRQPYDTFFWKGIDGSFVKAQLITAQSFDSDKIYTTYNSDLSVSEVMGAWKRYEPKAENDEVLLCYGFGDGGGGPTRAMIERGKRLEKGIPGAPKVKLEGIVPHLNRLKKRMDENQNRFPVWSGELYLQYHRETLTTVAKAKKNNRKAERLLRELEFLSSVELAIDEGAKYPTENLADYWKTVLINQFHDILPGTSIEEVFDDCDKEYAELFSGIDKDWHAKANAVALPQDGILKLFNFTSKTRDGELLKIPGRSTIGTALVNDSQTRPLQTFVNADGSSCFGAPLDNFPSLGWSSAQLCKIETAPAKTSLSVSKQHLENEFVRVEFDDGGEIRSIFDKTRNRELIEKGKSANAFVAYEDKCVFQEHEAWDVDRFFEDQFWNIDTLASAIEVVETGPYRAAIRIRRKYVNSEITQIISLAENAQQIEFDTFVNWQERQTLLKALFPFDMNTYEVRSEIQFGHVCRATHRNTSWDRARFEASMQRWVDISEPDFGVALLNDCKYGYDALDQMVRLTFLNGSLFPDPKADIGEHSFKYALKIHAGISDIGDVVVAAEKFNNPISVLWNAESISETVLDMPEDFSFAEVDTANVTLETVKMAEDGNGLIVRVFEHSNRRVNAKISFGIPVVSVEIVNLMENGASPVNVEENSVNLSLKPFEIITLRIHYGSSV